MQTVEEENYVTMAQLATELEVSHKMEIKPLIYHYLPFIKVIEPSFLADLLFLLPSLCRY